MALTRAQYAFTTEDLKVLLGVLSNEIVSHHIHKLVQVMYIYHFFFFSDLVHEVGDFMFYIISFSGTGGDDPYHVRVLGPQGDGSVSGVQSGGSRSQKCQRFGNLWYLLNRWTFLNLWYLPNLPMNFLRSFCMEG